VCIVLTAVSSICSRICHEKIKLQFCSQETFAFPKLTLLQLLQHCTVWVTTNKYWATTDVNNMYLCAELIGRDDIPLMLSP
jgi:hypothetical protein